MTKKEYSVFEKQEKERYEKTLKGSEYLYNDGCNGLYIIKRFNKNTYPSYILKDRLNNIYRPILEDVLKYFSADENNIEWWGLEGCSDNGKSPTAHVLSSQVCCINHLFPLRNDHDAVLSVARCADPEISDVITLENDTDNTQGYISFEVVSSSDYLNEGRPNRGKFCTSVDAVILGVKNGRKVMILIEWKYTESYRDAEKDLSKEDDPYMAKGNMKRGNTRLSRYSDLIRNSDYIVSEEIDDLRGSIFFFEPFYQLMRQTLWAEQMVKHNDDEIIKADDFIHVHVIPSANKDMLESYPPIYKKNLEDEWKSHLKHKDKYMIISPEILLADIDRNRYSELTDYLNNRYWNK